MYNTDWVSSTLFVFIEEMIGGVEPKVNDSSTTWATTLGFEYGCFRSSARLALTEEEIRGSNPPELTRHSLYSRAFSQTADSNLNGEDLPIDSIANL